MRFKFTVILLALNFASFGLIFYLDQNARNQDAEMSGLAGKMARKLPDADRIELNGRDLESKRILQRDGSNWTITEPLQWPANYFAINRILNQLQFLEEEASFSVEELEETGQTLADYGLEEPLLSITVSEGDRAVTLSIGTLTEIGNNVYLLGPDAEEIFVVDRQVIDSLLVDLSDLRTREIFEIPVFEVDALGLQIRTNTTADGSFLKVRLARNNGAWSFEAPLSAKADPVLVSNMINTLTAAKVGRFVSEAGDQLGPYGLDSPSMLVTLGGNQRAQTLLLGATDPEASRAPHYFAKLENNPMVFSVVAEPFDKLREAQEALRERNFMNFVPENVSTIHINGTTQKIRIQKLETGNWQVLESGTENEVELHRADLKLMEDLLENISGLRASGFAVDAPNPSDLERLGFNEPRRTVTVFMNENESLTLTLAHPEDENEALYAKTDDSSFIYKVPRRATLALFPLNTLEYRDRSLQTLPAAAEVIGLKISDLIKGKEIIDLDLSPSDREESLAEKQFTSPASVAQLVDWVRDMQVKRYLINEFTSEAYPVDSDRTLPWVFRLSATVRLPGGETDRMETFEYVLTERLSGTSQVGGSPKHGVIFELPQPLIDALYELTDDMELPPEAKEMPVVPAEAVEPLPEPQALPVAQP